MQFYKGLVTIEGSEEMECQFSFSDIVGVPYLCTLLDDNVYRYTRLERVFSFEVKDGLEMEMVEREE